MTGVPIAICDICPSTCVDLADYVAAGDYEVAKSCRFCYEPAFKSYLKAES